MLYGDGWHDRTCISVSLWSSDSDKQPVYLRRADVFLWWRWVCQSEERGRCRPPTSNLNQDRKQITKLWQFLWKEYRVDWYQHLFIYLCISSCRHLFTTMQWENTLHHYITSLNTFVPNDPKWRLCIDLILADSFTLIVCLFLPTGTFTFVVWCRHVLILVLCFCTRAVPRLGVLEPIQPIAVIKR